ncbi:2-methylcitrate synthase [Acidimicrobiia bacterium]|jgi:2-methylcitrate synthase|nr:2-methylcitrate synthase [Acidimicrobiia bacterium]
MDYSPGLRGVIAGETEISTVGMEGTSLRYRGYDAIELTKSHTYEDVASLIIDDSLDGKLFKKTFSKHYEELLRDEALLNLINNLKMNLHPMDVLRTAISYIGQADESNKLDAASKITAISCIAIASYDKEPTSELNNDFVVASSLLPNTASKEQLEALDDMLILYAEHGFNASTFAARVTASTRSDLTSAIVSGVGTLKGELHGGANEAAVELINSFDTPEDAEKGVYKLFEEKKKIMGFGHGVYKIQDPRSPVVKSWVEMLSKTNESINKYEIAKKVDEIMDSEKNLFPNVDFYGGLLLSELGFAVDLFTPIFVTGRSVGWSAHYFEQRKQDTLIRPAAKYTGIQER